MAFFYPILSDTLDVQLKENEAEVPNVKDAGERSILTYLLTYSMVQSPS